MDPEVRSVRGLEVTTSVMLGLVSLVTALGAWQAAVWNDRASELAAQAADARDVSINQAVFTEYSMRADRAAVAEARELLTLQKATDDELLSLYYDVQILGKFSVGRSTSGLAEAWERWVASELAPEFDPLRDPVYLAERQKVPDSYAQVSDELIAAAGTLGARSGVLGQAALIQAVSLFLLGISGITRLPGARLGLVSLGVVVFIAGLALATTAFGAA